MTAINDRGQRLSGQALLQKLIAMGKSMIAILLGTVLLLPAVLYTMQDSLIFLPPPAPATAPRAAHVEAVKVPVGDGLVLSGWLASAVAPAVGQRAPLVIYFGGNAEEVSYMAGMAPNVAPASLLVVNYRGYGGNPGSPGERALFADALALYDWAVARPDVDAARVVLMGRSLGSGVAVHVAAERKPAGVVLVTPYDSIRDVAQSMYPTVPVSALLRHPFDSLARAPAIDTPMLALVAERDQVIPSRHARRLFEAWRGPKQWREIAAADHDSISSAPEYWASIRDFLAAGARLPSDERR